MASCEILYPGNIAIETHAWTLSIAEAKAVQAFLGCGKGGFWERHLVKPYRQARRAKANFVKVYTAGFASGELSNALACCE